MTTDQIAAKLAAVRARRQADFLNVELQDGRVLSFANEASRDDFLKRAAMPANARRGVNAQIKA